MAACPDVDVVEVDPRDDAAFRAWFAVCEAADRHDRPGEPSWLLHEQQQASTTCAGPDADVRMVQLALHEAGRTVAAARLEMPQRDNLHLSELTFAVHPEHRRRGLARLLQDAVEQRAREHGRTTLLAFADEPPGTEGRSGNRLAAQALGYQVVQAEVRRDVDLPLDPERVAPAQALVDAHAASYDVVHWWDRSPEAHLEGLAALHGAMSTDVPKDQMDWREEVWDGARVRRDEDLALSMDRTHVGALAVHRGSGRAVAFTRIGVPRSARSRAYQWETLVQDDHRGRRLGVAVKLAALRELAAGSPETAFVSTWNAQENAPMIAVNDALGARVNGGLAVLQKVL